MTDDGEIIALLKPQFEAGREAVGKKGVVRDRLVHENVLRRIMDFVQTIALYPAGLTFSPIKGPNGNIEFLLWLKKSPSADAIDDECVVRVVAAAHGELDNS